MIKTKIIFPLIAIFFALSVQAEVLLKDNSEILGKWKVTAESSKLDGEKKSLIVEWEFKADGTLETKATDGSGRTQEMNIAIKYFVENGAIQKQETPGREKYETCAIVQRDGNQMVLKCKYLYYFLTKL